MFYHTPLNIYRRYMVLKTANIVHLLQIRKYKPLFSPIVVRN